MTSVIPQSVSFAHNGINHWENLTAHFQGLVHYLPLIIDIANISKVVNYVFFGIAISVAIARIIIRRWLQKQLRPDDYLLLLSSTCLISATAVLYYGTSSIFLAAELAFNPAAALQTGVDQAEMLRRIDLLLRITWAYLALSWATIFFVKFGFLWLFRHLVDRIPPMNRFWKVTLVFTGLLFAFALCEGFITCPKFGFESSKEKEYYVVLVFYLMVF